MRSVHRRLRRSAGPALRVRANPGESGRRTSSASPPRRSPGEAPQPWQPVSHTCTGPSSVPAASRRPSGLNDTLVTLFSSPTRMAPPPLCTLKARGSLPAARSHTRTVSSDEPLASRRPSGLNDTLDTLFSCPWRMRGRSPAQVPDAQRIVIGAAGKPPAVRAERYARDLTLAPFEDQAIAHHQIPDAHRLVRRATGQPPAVRAERHAIHPAFVSLEDEGIAPRDRVPHAHGPVRRATGQSPAVRAERHAHHRVGVSLEHERTIPRGQVPYPHRLVIRAAGQPAAVRAERHAPYHPIVPLENEGHAPRGQVPDAHRLVVRAAGQSPAVRAERHTRHRACVPFEDEGIASGGQVPHAHRLVRRTAGQAPAVRAERHTRHGAFMSFEDEGSAPAARSHTLTVWPAEPLARCRPSGLKDTLKIEPFCSLRTRGRFCSR